MSKGRADHIDQLVSKRLKMRRMILGLSQEDLSNAVHVSVQQIQKYEKAINRISSGKLWSFSKILKVSINYFYNQSEETDESIANVFAEESAEYQGPYKSSHVTEKEVVSLVRAFGDVKNFQVRKKIVELVKLMV